MRTACEEGDFEKAFELIKGGQNPRQTLPGSLKPLHYAAFYGNLEVVRKLIDKHSCNPRSADMKKCTPLHYAAFHGNLEVVKALVEEYGCKL